jgi:hypothetical protein
MLTPHPFCLLRIGSLNPGCFEHIAGLWSLLDQAQKSLEGAKSFAISSLNQIGLGIQTKRQTCAALA